MRRDGIAWDRQQQKWTVLFQGKKWARVKAAVVLTCADAIRTYREMETAFNELHRPALLPEIRSWLQ